MFYMIDRIKEEINWYKKALLIKEYHEKMIKTKGSKRGERWTMSDTARALELSIGYVSESLALAEHDYLSKFSRHIALKVLRNNGKV